MVKKEILIVNYQTLGGDIEKEFTILIGESAKENTQLIKDSNPDDLWFHFENVSSPHIILECGTHFIQKNYINEVARKLFKYKKNVPRNESVIYTEIKNVTLTKTDGLVIPKNIMVIKFNEKK